MEFPPNKMIATLRADVFDWVMKSQSVWMCISCYACAQVCPSKIPLTTTLMTRAKEELLLAGNVPTELQQALENSQRYGNVLGQSQRKRADWTKALKYPVPLMGQDRKSADVLWFVGDYGSYHPRIQLVSKAVAQVLAALGIDFGVLGPDENSDGDSQRLAGERGLFETLAAKNGQALRKYKFNQILVTDPHAYNAFKNQYPALGISYPVKHYTQFLVERLDQLKPLLKKAANMRVAYHDPCYLGRANDIYDEPRQLLQAIPGVELVEMSHHHTTSLCCGGGGGGMWMDGFQWEKAQARTTNWRIKEALAVKANTLAVACPYEPPRFEDAARNIREAAELAVKDIAELVADALND
ncbi:MAG: (Fe-S)-binding protein [Chloroflexi bacterium]|nr:(Fe-S)-binding protein [Chloroflexota bacterium]MCL5274292.1 (Fe-S)-binding protein [Chloroflexota bacterium]